MIWGTMSCLQDQTTSSWCEAEPWVEHSDCLGSSSNGVTGSLYDQWIMAWSSVYNKLPLPNQRASYSSSSSEPSFLGPPLESLIMHLVKDLVTGDILQFPSSSCNLNAFLMPQLGYSKWLLQVTGTHS